MANTRRVANLDRNTKVLIDHLCRPLQDAADALNNISESLRDWVTLQQNRYAKEYPNIKVSPATVGKANYSKGEEIPEEMRGPVFPEYIGPRETAAIKREARQARVQSRDKKRPSR